MKVIVKVLGTTAAISTAAHAGRYVVSWDSNVPFGTLEMVTTPDIADARRFSSTLEALTEWGARSKVQPNRPNDGRPNKPLTSLSITFVTINDGA